MRRQQQKELKAATRIKVEAGKQEPQTQTMPLDTGRAVVSEPAIRQTGGSSSSTSAIHAAVSANRFVELTPDSSSGDDEEDMLTSYFLRHRATPDSAASSCSQMSWNDRVLDAWQQCPPGDKCLPPVSAEHASPGPIIPIEPAPPIILQDTPEIMADVLRLLGNFRVVELRRCAENAECRQQVSRKT